MRPSKTGVEYMLPIFTNAIGHADIEAIRQTVFDSAASSARTTPSTRTSTSDTHLSS